MKRILSQNADTGTTTYFHADADGHHIQTVQDVATVIESAKQSFNSTDERAKWGEWTRVASIPVALYFELKAKGIADDPKAMKRWLNDRDNSLFRTRPGVV
jgi:hypothetical protein